MLIETPYKENDTITVRTTAGEEIVARFVEEDDTSITIVKPMALVATQQGMGLGPFAFTVDPSSKIKLSKHSVLFVHKTIDEMSKQYIASTTGLTLN